MPGPFLRRGVGHQEPVESSDGEGHYPGPEDPDEEPPVELGHLVLVVAPAVGSQNAQNDQDDGGAEGGEDFRHDQHRKHVVYPREEIVHCFVQ